MLKKLCYLVSIVVLIVVMGTNSANSDILKWSGNASPDPRWSVPHNWDKGVVPVGGDDAYCTKVSGKVDPNFTSEATMTEPLCLLSLADATTNGELNIDSGTIMVASALRSSKGTTSATSAKVTMKGGTVSLYGRGVVFATCTGTDIQDGYFSLGPDTGGVNINTTWTMTGGLITTGTFSVPAAGTLSHSVFNLNGGTVIVREPSQGMAGGITDQAQGFYVNEAVNTDRDDPNAHYRQGRNGLGILNVGGGTMIIQGDVTPLFKNRVDTTAAGGPVSMGLIDPCNAIVAYPTLSATSYNKYIVYDYDGRNDAKTTITAEARPVLEAFEPSPINGHKFVSTTPTLRWTGGTGATSHDVYFGTSTNPPFVITKTTINDPNYVPAAMALGSTWYWKIRENGTTAGPVWSFTVQGKSKGPSPVDGASIETDATRNVTLSWTAGAYATSHDVYFGTNSASLPQIADNNSTPIKRVQGTLGTTCFWRVDENSDAAHGSVTTPGTTWSFDMADYDRIDNFEQYASGTLNVIWNNVSAMPLTLAINSGRDNKDPVHRGKQGMKVSYTYGSAGSGSCRATFLAAQDWSSAQSGAVALSFWMRGKGNNGSLSNLYIQLASGTSTSSSFYSAKVPVYSYSTVILDEEWTNVNMALADFNGAGKGASFNLASVTRLFIGSSSAGATSGSLWVDDISLYPSRCVPDRDAGSPGAAVADITDDCVVNNEDLYQISDEWLDSDSYASLDGKLNKCKFDGNSVDGPYASFGKALKLGEPLDWVDVDDYAFPNFSNKTIAFWVRVDERVLPTNTKLLIFSTSNEWRLNINAEGISASPYIELNCQAGNQFTEPTTFGDTSVNEDEWHHVALTISTPSAGTVTVTMYVDGVLKAATSPEPHYYTKLTGACIGALNNGIKQHSNITIDDFRIYNVALTDTGTPSDIDKLADDDVVTTNPSATPLVKYDFNETTGTVAVNTGSLTSVYHKVGYVLGPPLIDVSLAELYSAEAEGSRKINLKDYSKVAKNWLYGSSPAWVFP